MRLPRIRRHEQGGAAGAGTSGRPFLPPHGMQDKGEVIIVCAEVCAARSSPRSTTPTRSRPRSGGPRSTARPSGSSGSSSSPAWSWGTVRFMVRHPLLDLAAAVAWLAWLAGGLARPGRPGGRRRWRCWCAAVWRPDWFARLVTGPARDRWRWWYYRRRWHGVLPIAGLAPRRWPGPGPGARQGPRGPVRRPGGGGPGIRPGARQTSPTGPRTWRTGSARCRAGSAPARPARWSWSWSAATRWPR